MFALRPLPVSVKGFLLLEAPLAVVIDFRRLFSLAPGASVVGGAGVASPQPLSAIALRVLDFFVPVVLAIFARPSAPGSAAASAGKP